MAKAAAAEWLERWRAAESRVDSVWNAALHEARMRLGHHAPPCLGVCHKCWLHDEIGKMMRGDPNNYVPVKERAAVAAKQFSAAPPKIRDPRQAYRAGVHDMLEAVKKMLSDKE